MYLCWHSFSDNLWIIKPVHDNSNKMACVPSEDSDQPGHPPSSLGTQSFCWFCHEVAQIWFEYCLIILISNNDSLAPFSAERWWLWGAVLLFIPYLWIFKIHFWISKNRFMDILKYIFGCSKISWLLDIHNSIFGYPKMNYGYPKIYPDFWISINQFLDIQKSADYWISIIRFMDIQKWIMDILKYTWF